MINWYDPKEVLPNEGQIVAVVFQHNKEHRPLSCEIIFGEAQYGDGGVCRVCTNDFTGKGNYSVQLKMSDEFDYSYDDIGLAWCDASELDLPNWIPHDKWWSE